MIPYVQSAASQEVPPPYHFPGVTVNAFLWEAQLAPIQAYADRYLNLGSAEERGFTYKACAFWPYAMLLFIDYPVMISASRTSEYVLQATPYSDRGIVTQREVFVALPLMRYGYGLKGLVLDTTLEWALPFIVVEQPMSAICGREMLGLEKLKAEIKLGEGVFPDSFAGSVTLPGWTSLTQGELQKQLPFLEVTTGPAAPTFRGTANQESFWTLLRSRTASDLIDGLGTLSDFVDTISLGTMPTAMRTISLKQFRDAAQPEKAVYQALISCRSKYSAIQNIVFYKEPDVSITFHDEGSFHGILKVFLKLPDPDAEVAPTGRSYSFQPKAAYRFNANIDFDEMRTVHTFTPVFPGAAGGPSVPGQLLAPRLRPWQGFFRRPGP